MAKKDAPVVRGKVLKFSGRKREAGSAPVVHGEILEFSEEVAFVLEGGAKPSRIDVRKEMLALDAATAEPLGSLGDALYEFRKKRRELAAQVDLMDLMDHEVEKHLIKNFAHAELEGIRGKVSMLGIQRDVVPTVAAEDWPKVFAYIKRTGSFDLLQRRLSKSAVEQRWSESKKIPGIGKFTVIKLSVRKIGR